MCRSMMLGAAASAILMVTSTASPAADVTFDLKYGVLAGLTGDPAPDGQAWNEAARLAIEQIQKSLDRLKISGIKVELSDFRTAKAVRSRELKVRRNLSTSTMCKSLSATSIHR